MTLSTETGSDVIIPKFLFAFSLHLLDRCFSFYSTNVGVRMLPICAPPFAWNVVWQNKTSQRMERKISTILQIWSLFKEFTALQFTVRQLKLLYLPSFIGLGTLNFFKFLIMPTNAERGLSEKWILWGLLKILRFNSTGREIWKNFGISLWDKNHLWRYRAVQPVLRMKDNFSVTDKDCYKYSKERYRRK